MKRSSPPASRNLALSPAEEPHSEHFTHYVSRLTRHFLLISFFSFLFIASCTAPYSVTPSPLLTSSPAPLATPSSLLTSSPVPSPIPSPTPIPLQHPQYTLNLLIDYTYKSALVEETILYPNLSAESLLNLMLAVEPNLWTGAFNLKALAVDGVPIGTYRLEGQRLEISLPQPLYPGSVVNLSLTYSLILPQIPADSDPNKVRPQIYGYTSRQVNLVGWYPFIVPYIPGTGWVLHNPWYYGEHLVYDCADFDVIVRFDDASEPKIAASGLELPSEAGRRFHLENGRTFALSFSTLYEVKSEVVGGVTVYSYYFPFYESSGEAVLNATAQALQAYTQHFGPYPHTTLTAIQGDFNDGMEFSGLHFLSHDFYNLYDGTPQNYLTIVAAHETAHQWWFDLVGNNQALEPWLDEALSTYSERIFYAQYYPELVDWWWSYRVNFYQPAGWLDVRIYDAGGYRPYTDAVYLRGAGFLEDLRQRIGDETFFAFLKDYAAQYAHRRATTADFFALLRQHTSVDYSDIIGKYFKGSH